MRDALKFKNDILFVFQSWQVDHERNYLVIFVNLNDGFKTKLKLILC